MGDRPSVNALHHRVERREVPLDELDQVHRVVFHLGHRLAEALVGLEVGHQAEGHHRQRLLPQVAEEEPVGPDAVEVLVEFPHVRDAVEFGGIVLIAVDQELEAAHQGGQLRALGKGVGAEALEEVRELVRRVTGETSKREAQAKANEWEVGDRQRSKVDLEYPGPVAFYGPAITSPPTR